MALDIYSEPLFDLFKYALMCICVFSIQFFARHANRNIKYDTFKPIDQVDILAMHAVVG